MGDVLRVLATCRPRLLQSLMHDRIVLEACENVHLHWRNVRLEMSLSDAARLLDICRRLKSILAVMQGQVVSVPLAAICPYDDIHRRTGDDEFENESVEATERHKRGIAWMVEQMKAGRQTWPIAIRPAWCGGFTRIEDRQPGQIWQRLDGFKRYMAHKALGLLMIDCFVIASHRPGCQHGHRAFLEDAEQLPRFFDKGLFITSNPDQLSLIDADKQRYLVNEVELLRNGTIHVHLGDVRLEFTREEFNRFANMISQAHVRLDKGFDRVENSETISSTSSH